MARDSRPDSAQRLTELHDRLIDAVAELTDSTAWQRMLQTAARFPTYSPSNVLLVTMQRPDATRVAGLRTWNRLGRHVIKGEHGIAILAPCTYPPRRDEQDTASPPAAGPEPAPITASPSTNTDTSEPPAPGRQLRGFRVVHVFDVTQTDGAPLPDVTPTLLTGQSPARLWEQLAAQVADAEMRLETGPCPPGVNGYTAARERAVRVSDTLDPAQAVKTLAHEVGHIRADHSRRFPDYGLDQGCRGIAEVEAESIAYLVTAVAGLDSLPYTVPYVASWSGGDVEVLKASATAVVRTSQAICRDLEEARTSGAGSTPGTGRWSGRSARDAAQPTAHRAVPAPTSTLTA